MLSPAFEKALAFTLKEEGGYSNTPGDRGHATNYGVTQATYDDWRKKKNLPLQPVKFITREEATALYFEEYWVGGHCNALPDNLAAVHFDTGVNSGVGEAARLLQQALCVKVDGDIGEQTIAAAHASDESTLVLAYVRLREAFDRRIALNDPSQRKFLSDWLGRNERLRKTFG